jgi:hypothetical protein
MKTTQIILEHLIAGIQMLIWLLLFICAVTGTAWLDYALLLESQTAVLAVAVAFVYPMGILIDNLADQLLRKPERHIRASIPGAEQSMSRLLYLLKDDNMTESFDYLRMRIRITRSAFLNGCFLTLAAWCYTGSQLQASPMWGRLMALEGVLGLLLIGLSYYSWRLLTQSVCRKVAKRYQELSST